jgi:2-polyprenyl-3-methyl-5-hydroxy-6-metoxy-1,4-benzoquinol methylase
LKALDLESKPADYFDLERPEMLVFIPAAAKKVLEFGCGAGKFGYTIKQQKQAEVWGLEIEEGPAQQAAQKLDRVIVGDAMQKLSALPDGYFEVIVFNDVLEHLVDPYTVLSELRKKLSPAGVVVASIPNIRFFRTFFDFVFRGRWEYTENGIMDKTHLRFFTKSSMANMFVNCGYEVVLQQGINRSKSLKPRLAAILTLGAWRDIGYLQYAVIARTKN